VSSEVAIERPRESPAHPAQSRWTSAVLLISIAVLTLLLVISGFEAVSLHRERAQLRLIAGHLDIKDPTKIYAVRIDTKDPYQWAWRIYLPENHQYRIQEYTGRMPAETRLNEPEWHPSQLEDAQWRNMHRIGFGGTSGGVNAGDFLLRVALTKESDGNWRLTARSLAAGSSGSFRYRSDWIDDRAWSEATDVPMGEQVELPAQNGILLLRLRNEPGVGEGDPLGVTETIYISIMDESAGR
jgi:hypothetical protein